VRIDPELVRDCQRGREGAMDELIRATYAEVYGLCRRMLHNDADAADATQEVFMRVCRSVLGFRGDSTFGTWLHRVTVNVCLSALRQRRLTTPLDEHDHADPAAGPEQRAEVHDQAVRAAAALAQLPEAARSVVLLRDVEGLSGREVAVLLGVSEDVVKVRLHRAHARLRQMLEVGS
jgi:RNA polymerase sigma-70 factor (ECF subfamily)